MPESELRAIWGQFQPPEGETIAGYEVYAVDCTATPRPEAETMPGRLNLKRDKEQVVTVGEKFSWLVRLVKPASSWIAPQDIERVCPQSTDSAVAVTQVQALDKQNERLKVVVLRVEFLKADDTQCYKTPLYLFWTGPLAIPLEALCRMYLWRFAIEHAFRFLKQRLGLNACCSTNPAIVSCWMWLVALAYWQLLLMAPSVGDHRPAWRRTTTSATKMLTPGIVHRRALAVLWGFGTPAATPRPAGKGHGRPKGYRPPPKKRYPVVCKCQKRPQKAKKSG